MISQKKHTRKGRKRRLYMAEKTRVKRIFRIVLLALAGSFIYAMYSGIRNNFGIMLGSIVESSGLSFASVSFILAVGQLVFGLVQPLFGALAAKKGTTPAFISGVVLAVTGMVLTPLCRSIFPLMLCLGVLVPAGCGAISYGLIMGTLTPKLPAKAVSGVSGIVNASSGIGNTVLSPVITALLSAGGLARGMLVMAVPVVLTLPASLWMGRKSGAPPPGRTPENPGARPFAPVGGGLRRALTSTNYIFLMAGFFTCGFHMALITNHLPTQIRTFGFSAEVTAYAFSVYGIVTMVGSIVSGSLCGRLRMKNILGFYYALRPVTIALFLLVPKTLLTVFFFTALFGFSGAATVPSVSGLISRAYGAANLATFYGLVFFVHQIGGFLGAWLGGICLSVTGSYTGIWCASLVMSTLAAVVSFAIREDSPAAEVPAP